MAQQSFKDPYIFNFMTLQKDYIEKDIEQGLIDNIQKFLLGVFLVMSELVRSIANLSQIWDNIIYEQKNKKVIDLAWFL
jgi:predicted nuclease of restriction endonuclease-like (RecB) superfamily